MRSTDKGASSLDAEGVTGRCFSNRKVKISEESFYYTGLTNQLWSVSADLVGIPANITTQR